MLPSRTLVFSGLVWAAMIGGCSTLSAQIEYYFQRGDTNLDGQRDISDPITLLEALFGNGPLDCADAGDANDDGAVDVADVTFILNFLFQGGPALPDPFDCGPDPTTTDSLGCGSTPPGYCPTPLPAPDAPAIDSYDEYTSNNVVLLTGSSTAPPGSLLQVGSIDGINAQTVVDPNGLFTVQVPLLANAVNMLSVRVQDQGIWSMPTPVTITQDGTPPVLFVDAPGETVEGLTATVVGRVGDHLTGHLGLTVTVNGDPATVDLALGANATWVLANVPLSVGPNTLTVVATDALGNSVPLQRPVEALSPPGDAPLITIVSGDGQIGEAQFLLTEPLRVRVTESDGVTPFVNKLVTFEVVRGDGRLFPDFTLPPIPDVNPEAMIRRQSRTDGQGIASVSWQLGTTSGAGLDRVRVTAAGVFGDVLFCAVTDPAPPAFLTLGMGNDQVGAAGTLLAEPLRVWVSDRTNGIPNVPVEFTVVSGGGVFATGSDTQTVLTDATGHAEVDWILGGSSGIQYVSARSGFSPSGEVIFNARAVQPIYGPTIWRGLVVDNTGCPLGGVTCTLRSSSGGAEYEAVTDSAGAFRIENIQETGPGQLVVDGRTTTSVAGGPATGSYPQLHHMVQTFPGIENALAGPIRLPFLNPSNAQIYDGTQGITLTCEGIDGLRFHLPATTTVIDPEGNVVDANNPITLSVDQVHHDDIPMAMPDGVAPPFAWTIQPGGTTFDPPLAIEYPNMSALAPGSQAFFLSFDHDTMRFEIVASGQVSSDGSTIHSDPGTGIDKAGWGCNCPPYSVAGECEQEACESGGGGNSSPLGGGCTLSWNFADPRVFKTLIPEPAGSRLAIIALPSDTTTLNLETLLVGTGTPEFSYGYGWDLPSVLNFVQPPNSSYSCFSITSGPSPGNGTIFMFPAEQLYAGPFAIISRPCIFQFNVRTDCGCNLEAQLYFYDVATIQTSYAAWLAANPVAPTWASDLPPLPANANAEPNTVCPDPNSTWGDLEPINTTLHPGATQERRSVPITSTSVSWPIGHQVTFNSAGVRLDQFGLAAGTADYSHKSNFAGNSHKLHDVIPFFKALILDGNPIGMPLIPTYILGTILTLDDIVDAGEPTPLHFQDYVQRRPTGGGDPCTPPPP